MAQLEPQPLKLRSQSRIYRLLVGLIGIGLLGINYSLAPGTLQGKGILMVVILMLMQVNFLLFLMHSEISLTHVIGLVAGSCHGRSILRLGALIGYYQWTCIASIWPKRWHRIRPRSIA